MNAAGQKQKAPKADRGIDRGALEAERDFLLRSLDDLEEERAAGNVDDGTYQELHDDYTARAAAVIRSLETGTNLKPPDRAPASTTVRVLTVGGVLVFAIVAAFLLTHAVGQRRAGQTITGNNQVNSSSSSGSTTVPDPGPALKSQAKAEPKSYDAQIAYARYLLQTNDYTDALHEYGAAAVLDPSQPEPPAYAGWAGALIAQPLKAGPTRQSLLEASLTRINEVIAAHPKYPDAYALKGVIIFDFEREPAHAIPSLQEFLVLTSDTNDTNPLRPQVLQVLAQAEKAVHN